MVTGKNQLKERCKSNLEVVDRFWYLEDMQSLYGSVTDSKSGRIGNV